MPDSEREHPWSALLPAPEVRRRIWAQLVRVIEKYTEEVERGRVTPELAVERMRDSLKRFDFREPVPAEEAIRFVADGLTEFQTHTSHPRYFGLFNPAPTTMGIVADTLVAAFNPQLAAWSHSPLAAEMERHMIRALGARFGYSSADTDGAFCTGGMEANHTALLTALTSGFPGFDEHGARAIDGRPVLYVSTESHHSFVKAARMCGLGGNAVRHVPVDTALRMRPDALLAAIEADLAHGARPFLVAATAGTTNAGAIDPLGDCGHIARRYGLWFHADAAWGGAAAFLPELRSLLGGIEDADSITFDAHKWLSVPMGAGIYLTRHADILDRTFGVHTAYMPREAAGLDVVDPHLHTMQWSRRFIGLKVFLSMAVAGENGYANALRHQTAMGDLLRTRLAQSGWQIENETPLPIVCFTDSNGADPHTIAMRVVGSGEAWISTTVLAGSKTVLRACITNYRTTPADISALIQSLGRARVDA
ncbi:MAG: aminotransferase class V-fold PLP-dependent enzyme [Bryobacteraceae bacterium]|jgi:glutamate/tyrosine decarboxylase-like PLP-dependent enzyme